MHDEGHEIGRRSSSNRTDLSMKRQGSLLHNLSIIAPSAFQRAPSEQRDIAMVPQTPHQYHRQQHHGNVFTGFRSEQMHKTTEAKVNTAQTYERECLEYEKYLFDSRIKMIIKRMAIKAYNIFKNEKEGQFFVFPIQKLLVTIAKKLLLNRFQLLFLQYVFEETKWRYDFECIRKHVALYKSFMMIPDSEAASYDLKLMEVYILYCAYFSKKSLNQLSVDNMFSIFCHELCHKFKQLFAQWTQISQMGARIKPKQLNAIFKRLTSNFERDQEDIQNYCLIVQEIIDISPAYNADKSGKQKKIRKAKKKQTVNRQEEEQPPRQSQMRQQSNNRYPQIVQQEESLEIDPPIFKQKKSSVLSVDLLEAGHYLTRSASQHERR